MELSALPLVVVLARPLVPFVLAARSTMIEWWYVPDWPVTWLMHDKRYMEKAVPVMVLAHFGDDGMVTEYHREMVMVLN